MSNLLCLACGKSLKHCRYNAHHQKYCKRSGCVRRRKQERQREYQKRRYCEDLEYQAAKRRKSREYMRERRKKEAGEKKTSFDINPVDILTGIVAQLTDEDDPETLEARLRSYCVRGRQLSRPGVVFGQSP